MNRFYSLLVAVFLLALPVAPAAAQLGLGFGFERGVFWDDRFDDIRIGAVARKAIEEHLAQEYKRLCSGKKAKPAVCEEQRPFYKSSALPERGVALPKEVLEKIAFIYPGTAYRQVGFSVYLVRLPDRRIYDLVSMWSDGWN